MADLKHEDFQSARSQLETEKAELVERIKKLSGDIETLDRAWAILNQSRPVNEHDSIKIGTDAPQTLAAAVRNFAKRHKGTFSGRDVEESIKAWYPELVPTDSSSYMKPLRRMALNKELEIVVKAAGTRPAIFRGLGGGEP